MSKEIGSALEEYCNFVKRFRSNTNIFILDTQFTIIYSSDVSKEYFANFTTKFNVGNNLFDVLKEMPYFDVKQQIFNTMLTNKKVNGFFITKMLNTETNEHIINRVSLSPIMDIESNVLIGIDVELINMDFLPVVNILHDNTLPEELNLPHLTQREREIIFLKSIGKTNLEISQLIFETQKISVTEKTINNITLQQIYPKLGVVNKKALLKKIHELSLDRFIPRTLIYKDQLILLSPLNSDDIQV